MIVPLTFADALHVALNMRESDWRQITSNTWHCDRAEYAFERFKAAGMAFSVRLGDNTPVCIGGLSDIGPGVMNCWLIGTDDFPRAGPWVWRFAVKRLIPTAFEAGVRRVQALILEDYPDAIEFAERAGLQQEGLLRGLGTGGENYWCYARLNNGRW